MCASHLPYDIRKKQQHQNTTLLTGLQLLLTNWKNYLICKNLQEHQSKNELACENTVAWAQKSNSLRVMGRLYMIKINANDII